MSKLYTINVTYVILYNVADVSNAGYVCMTLDILRRILLVSIIEADELGRARETRKEE